MFFPPLKDNKFRDVKIIPVHDNKEGREDEYFLIVPPKNLSDVESLAQEVANHFCQKVKWDQGGSRQELDPQASR